jgi:ABC-type sugar transport system ATPase subunit
VAKLELRSIEKTFGSVAVIHGVSLTVEHGEFVVFVGPSGCGKSTLLRMIAGLDHPTGGHLLIDGEEVNQIGAADRGCAMVFQSYALYPHMTVYANMAFGLENAKVPRAEIEKKVNEAATMLRLDHLLQRRPTQLSGGQRQRVAIGRAIVRNPKIFLFDEPLSNLDAELRVSMRTELRDMHQRLGATMIYVTHDQVEAMTMADKIVVLRDGRIEQIGTPEALYKRPCNQFVAGFIGSPRMNFLPVSAISDSSMIARSLPKGTAHLGVRPEHFLFCDPDEGIRITIRAAEYLGAHRLVHAELQDHTRVEILVNGDVTFEPGAVRAIKAEAPHRHAFDAKGQRIEETAE